MYNIYLVNQLQVINMQVALSGLEHVLRCGELIIGIIWYTASLSETLAMLQVWTIIFINTCISL